MSRRGIPNFVATPQMREMVELFSAAALSHQQMAFLIRVNGEPISVDTLTRHFVVELETGKANMQAKIAGRVMRCAAGLNDKATVRDELIAAFFYLKTQCGWKETMGLELSDPAEDEDEVAIAARIAGLLEKGRRQARAKKDLN